MSYRFTIKAIIVALAQSCLLLSYSAQAATSVANPKATATISSSCQISAQNLSFGALVLPVSAQSASSSMSVLCSKNAPYTIGLAYGGIYGKGTASGDYYVSQYAQTHSLYWYEHYSSTGVDEGSVYMTSIPSGYAYNGSAYVNTNQTYYTYGLMSGVASGDTIGYSIQVPGNPAQVWNAGNSSYAGTGSGATQTLPVVGKLVPAQSSSTYPTPDAYMDTVTATVSF